MSIPAAWAGVALDSSGVNHVDVPAQVVRLDSSGANHATAMAATTVDLTTFTLGGGSNRLLVAALIFGRASGPAPTSITITWDPAGANQALTQVTSTTASDGAGGAGAGGTVSLRFVLAARCAQVSASGGNGGNTLEFEAFDAGAADAGGANAGVGSPRTFEIGCGCETSGFSALPFALFALGYRRRTDRRPDRR